MLHFPLVSAAFCSVNCRDFKFYVQEKEQGHQADKQSHLVRFLWKTQICDLWKAAMKILPNSRAVL